MAAVYRLYILYGPSITLFSLSTHKHCDLLLNCHRNHILVYLLKLLKVVQLALKHLMAINGHLRVQVAVSKLLFKLLESLLQIIQICVLWALQSLRWLSGNGPRRAAQYRQHGVRWSVGLLQGPSEGALRRRQYASRSALRAFARGRGQLHLWAISKAVFFMSSKLRPFATWETARRRHRGWRKRARE